MKQLLTILMAMSLTASTVSAQDKESRTLGSFNHISVGESIELVIEQGDENMAYIEARGIDAEKVLTEISGSKLRIHLDKGWYQSSDVFVRLVYKENLRGIKSSSSSDLTSKTIIKSDELLLKVSSSGSAELNVDVEDLTIDVSSSGKLYVDGRAKSLDIEVSSSGRVQGYGLTCGSARVDMSSSGRAEITVLNTLRGEASSSGRFTYKGDPEKVLVDTSSSGRISAY